MKRKHLGFVRIANQGLVGWGFCGGRREVGERRRVHTRTDGSSIGLIPGKGFVFFGHHTAAAIGEG